MLRGNAQHNGFVEADLRPPFRLVWAREIGGERLGTAVEPIVAGGKLFVGTHAGNLYALDLDSGDAVWSFRANGPFLASPGAAEGMVVAGSTDGNLYAIQIESGKPLWQFPAGRGGFSAAPTISDGAIYLGTRSGDFLAVSLKDGHVLWRQHLDIPIRQTAAVDGGLIYVTADDLRLRCFRGADGLPEWTSAQMAGQTARDYYPVIVTNGTRRLVVVRTNPLLNMGQRIGRDRSMLCRNAGVDDASWQNVDAWIKGDQARGAAELWQKEQTAVTRYLAKDPTAQSFFVFDAATGQQAFVAPVLWIGGCQGVGAEPAQTADGRLLVFYRSAYGNWNQGVAPLVALGLLDLQTERITPLFHQQGQQPAWNCFWGTADESQNFLVAGSTALIVHQGTLSGFDLNQNRLFPIGGKRDTYGGFPNPSWARNEWHGPARSGVAVVGNRILWQTGSRILCIAAGEAGTPELSTKPAPIRKHVPTTNAAVSPALERKFFREELNATAASILRQKWAPLFTDPGLAGRVFSFDNSGELFESLAWAYPHLSSDLQNKARLLLWSEWTNHALFTPNTSYPLKEGIRREWFQVSTEFCQRLGRDTQRQPFGDVYVAWLFAERCNGEDLLLAAWPRLKAAYQQFKESDWHLNPAKGDPFANRYLASLRAFGRISAKAGDPALANEAQMTADATTTALVKWWERAAAQGTLQTFNTSSALDNFISNGDGVFLSVAPHRHTLALFEDLTPEIAALVRDGSPAAVARVWQTFCQLCPTWYLTGEERQVHFGENFVDPPQFALNGFKAMAWLRQSSFAELSPHVDLPFCRADSYYLTKLALALEAQ